MNDDLNHLHELRNNVEVLLRANTKFIEQETDNMTFVDRVHVTQTIAILSSSLLLADYIEFFAQRVHLAPPPPTPTPDPRRRPQRLDSPGGPRKATG